MIGLPAALVSLRAAHMAQPVAAAFSAPLPALQARFGATLAAVLLYGSCRRQQDPGAGVIDLYVVVDDYAGAHGRRAPRWGNALLPPNVYYLEAGGGESPLRVKYALLSRADFRRLNARAFHSYFWARFCQPVSLLHARDGAVATEIAAALADATVHFLRCTVPLLDTTPVSAPEVFARGFRLSYGAELRPESAHRAGELVRGDAEFFVASLDAALPALPALARCGDTGFVSRATGREQRACRRAWRLRRVQGVMLSVLRLAKAAFTFSGGVDYAAWKVERHTGVQIEVTPRLRRHPLLFGWRVLRQLIQRGVLR